MQGKLVTDDGVCLGEETMHEAAFQIELDATNIGLALGSYSKKIVQLTQRILLFI